MRPRGVRERDGPWGVKARFGDPRADLLARLRVGICAVVAAMTATVMVGWAAGIDGATRLAPGWAAMRPVTALSALVLAACLLLPRRVSLMLVVVPGLLAVVTLAEYAVGASTASGVDQVLFTVGDDGGPVRMAFSTAACLALVSTTQLLPERWSRVVELLSLAVMAVSGVAMLGYLYGVSVLYSVGQDRVMAFSTALVLFLLAVATFASVPGGAATWLLRGGDPGAILLRQLLPVVFVAIPLAGSLVLVGEGSGWFGWDFRVAALVVCAMGLVGGASWYTARQLARMDGRRREVLAQLQQVNADLEERVRTRAAELERERSRSEVLDDRQRIAADMHDHVIQGLYAVALQLDAAGSRRPEPGTVEAALRGIDEAIRDLRASIFELKHPPHAGDLAARLRRLTDTAGSSAAVSVRLTTAGTLDAVSDTVAEHLVAATREAISNAVRHAGAATIDVDLEVDGEIVLSVADDGQGFDPAVTASSGLRNMRRRAEQLGGSCTWERRAPHGTAVTWRAPVAAVAAVEADEDRRGTAGAVLAALEAVTTKLDATRDPAGDLVAMIGAEAAAALGADGMAVVLDGRAGEDLVIRAAAGFPDGSAVVGRTIARSSSVAGFAMEAGRALNTNMLSDLPVALSLFGRLPFGPALVVPVSGEVPARAALVLARHSGEPPFTDDDLAEARVLAGCVGLALALRPDPPS